MAINNAGLRVDGHYNPNWKGGLIKKICQICLKEYSVKRVHSSSRFCSLKCVGISQRGKKTKTDPKITIKKCEVCEKEFSKPTSHADRYYCCSSKCSRIRRSYINAGNNNPNWNNGASRLPYPYNFSEISKKIIERDGNKCQNPGCDGKNSRLTTHHINHDKQDSSPTNLIALCSACNSKANFNRPYWVDLYGKIMRSKTNVAAKPKAKKNGGGWEYEVFE